MIKKRVKAFKYAFNGIAVSLKTQANMWIHTTVAILVIGFGIWLEVTMTEWLVVFLCFGLVISAEIFNTAIEEIVNLVSPEKNEQAGKIKDLAAGAVLVAAIFAAAVGGTIFFPKLYFLFTTF